MQYCSHLLRALQLLLHLLQLRRKRHVHSLELACKMVRLESEAGCEDEITRKRDYRKESLTLVISCAREHHTERCCMSFGRDGAPGPNAEGVFLRPHLHAHHLREHVTVRGRWVRTPRSVARISKSTQRSLSKRETSSTQVDGTPFCGPPRASRS